MLSIRALARRSASRLATSTIRSRPAVQSFIKCSSIAATRHQPFSLSASRRDDSGIELAAKLQTEINLESENSEAGTDSDANVKQFLAENDMWSVEDNEGEQDVLMRRKYDDEEITVSFSIADFNSNPYEDPESDEAFADEEDDIETAQSGGANTKGAVNQGRTPGGNVKVAPEDSIAPADREELRNDEDDYQQDQAFPANVHVLIQRQGKPGALRVHLVTDGQSFTVHSVTHLPQTASSADAKEVLRSVQDNYYTGPPFQQLDDDVQSLMEQYLEHRGMDTRLAMFIPDYIDVKEQKEYIAWLGRMKEFVEE